MDAQPRPELRVGDAEREAALERLRTAHAEGRLDVDEFYARMDSVYTARTFGDLDTLVADLPPAGTTRFPAPQQSVSAPQRIASTPVAPASGDGGAELAATPASLRAMWLTWATVVSITVVVWLAVSLASADVTYFWPGWVAGPWGVVNLGMTASWWFNRGQEGGRPQLGPP